MIIKKKGFYDYSRISYIYRLPVIEPYEIVSPDNGSNWTISFKTESPPSHGVQFLTKIGVQNSLFVVYSPSDLSFSSDHPEIWAVIDLIKKEERIFTNENDYKSHLRKKEADVRLYDIKTVFAEFDKSKNLPAEWPKK